MILDHYANYIGYSPSTHFPDPIEQKLVNFSVKG